MRVIAVCVCVCVFVSRSMLYKGLGYDVKMLPCTEPNIVPRWLCVQGSSS